MGGWRLESMMIVNFAPCQFIWQEQEIVRANAGEKSIPPLASGGDTAGCKGGRWIQ